MYIFIFIIFYLISYLKCKKRRLWTNSHSLKIIEDSLKGLRIAKIKICTFQLPQSACSGVRCEAAVSPTISATPEFEVPQTCRFLDDFKLNNLPLSIRLISSLLALNPHFAYFAEMPLYLKKNNNCPSRIPSSLTTTTWWSPRSELVIEVNLIYYTCFMPNFSQGIH